MKLKSEIFKYVKLVSDGCYNENGSLDLIKLLKKLKIESWNSDMGGNPEVSGAIVKESEDQFVIYVNENHHLNRKRFTACHELGHYISYLCNSYSKEEFDKNGFFEDTISGNPHVLTRRDDLKNEAETEANQIAAELLMPSETIQKLIHKGLFIEEMAAILGVSYRAMEIRLNSLIKGFAENNHHL